MEYLEAVLSDVKIRLLAQHGDRWVLDVEGVLFGGEDIRSVIERMHDALGEQRLILTLRRDE